MIAAVKTSVTADDAISAQPLADRMRPARIEDVVGQSHLLAPGKPLRRAVESGVLHSMILWGPPGSGKTTLARIVDIRCRLRRILDRGDRGRLPACDGGGGRDSFSSCDRLGSGSG